MDETYIQNPVKLAVADILVKVTKF